MRPRFKEELDRRKQGVYIIYLVLMWLRLAVYVSILSTATVRRRLRMEEGSCGQEALAMIINEEGVGKKQCLKSVP